MLEPFRERDSGSETHYAFECPMCGTLTERRRDSFQPGLHVMICQNFGIEDDRLVGKCGYSTDLVLLRDGRIEAKGAAAFRGGGD